MRIPFYDLQLETGTISKKLIASFKLNIDKSWFILGKDVELFEKEWAQYVKVKHAMGVASGSDALTLSLKALGIGAGDEVIVPSLTFVSTAFAVSLVGAKPVLVDVDSETHLINPVLLEGAITKKTKAIIPVHLYGSVSDMDEINKVANKHKLFVIEDAAQAHGATYRGKKTGALSDIACFSFYPAKNLGALGDGGIIVTNNKKLAEKVLILRNCGQRKKYYSDIIGYNSRLDTIQAGFLRVKLKTLDIQNIKRRKLAEKYKKLLGGLPLTIPSETKKTSSAHHLFTINVEKRDIFMKKLAKLGVQTLIHYPIPVHLQKAYTFLGYKKGSFPVSEKIADTTVSLPFFPSMTQEQLEYVVSSIKKVL